MKLTYNLNFFILLAMILGATTGILMGSSASIFKPLGEIFIQLIKMLVVPLVLFSLISGASNLVNIKSPTKIALFVLSFFLISTVLAIVLGLFLGNVFHLGENISDIKHLFKHDPNLQEYKNLSGFWNTILSIIPKNPFLSLVDGSILQVLFFAIFFGISISLLPNQNKKIIIELSNTINDALIWMMLKIMYIAPIGIFGLIADTVGNFGFNILYILLKLFLVFILANVIYIYGFLSVLVKLFSRVGYFNFLKNTLPVKLMAFTTASSLTTLPINIESSTKMGVSKEISSFVLTLGATINMNGNGIFYAVTTIFFANIFNIDLTFNTYILIVITSLLGAIGTAGVPGPSLLLVVVLVSANIPLEGLALIFGVDRIFDMIRTTTNCIGNSACSILTESYKKRLE
jgi:Na+/H+-dicarboxylate symporter